MHQLREDVKLTEIYFIYTEPAHPKHVVYQQTDEKQSANLEARKLNQRDEGDAQTHP